MTENLRYIYPLRTEDLAALLVSELIDEDRKAKNDVVKQERGFGVEAVKYATTT